MLDDGFQHRRLFRDLDLVLIDATQPWGHGQLLPRGLLREPKSGLRRAHLVALTRCDQVGEADRTRLRQEVGTAGARRPGDRDDASARRSWSTPTARTAPPEALRGRPAAAFCGVGNPEAFRRTLIDCGATCGPSAPTPTTTPTRGRTWTNSAPGRRELPADCHVIVTQKDLVKLRLSRLGDRPLWSLRIRLHVEAGAGRAGAAAGSGPGGNRMMRPLDLNGLKTYELRSRPSKVFVEDLGRPAAAATAAAVGDWLDGLPRQLAANDLRKVRDHLCRARDEGRTVVAALGGHVIKTGCGPYLIDWIHQGLLKAVALNGAAAIHDFELALAGKTSEDVGAS